MSERLLDVPEDPQPCVWCEAPTTRRVLVEPTLVRKIGGVPKVIEAARYAPGCKSCGQKLITVNLGEQKKMRAKASKNWKQQQERMC